MKKLIPLFLTLSLVQISIANECVVESKSAKYTLHISPEISNYDRHAFGPNHFWQWVDADQDCQNTRAEILISSSLTPITLTADKCHVLNGLWLDPYSGNLFENAKDLDIDHIVPLKELYESGGADLGANEKILLANSLLGPSNLIAVWNSLNRSKRDLEPHQWLPPNIEYKCEYLSKWLKVKHHWGLSVDYDECVGLQHLYIDCPNQSNN